MKLLILLFLVGYAAASAGDGYDRTLEGVVNDLLGEPSEFVFSAEGDDDIKTELGKKLRETLDHILEKIKEALEHGKTVREETLVKVKEIREKLKELKVELGNKAKELLEKIKEKAKDFWQKILDRLGLKDDKDAEFRAAVFAVEVEEFLQRAEDDEDIKTEMGKKLREALDNIMEKIKESIEQGKAVKEDVINRLKEVREKMKELKIDMSEKAKELLNKLKEKAKDFLKDLLDKLGLKDKRSAHDVAHAEGKLIELFKKLKKHITEIMDKEKLKEKIESIFGKGNEVAENIINMLKEKGEKGKKKLLDWIDRILGDDKEKETRSVAHVDLNIKEIFRKLKKLIEEKATKEKVKEAVEKYLGKGVITDYIVKLLNEKGEKYKQKLLDFLDRFIGDEEYRSERSIKDLWEKVKDYFEKLNIQLKEKYVKFGEWVKENASKGLDKAKDKIENLKVIAREMIDKAKELKKDIAAEGMEFLKQYKDDLGTVWDEFKKSMKEVFNRED